MAGEYKDYTKEEIVQRINSLAEALCAIDYSQSREAILDTVSDVVGGYFVGTIWMRDWYRVSGYDGPKDFPRIPPFSIVSEMPKFLILDDLDPDEPTDRSKKPMELIQEKKRRIFRDRFDSS